MEELRSWWEVPSIAHFCSLFRAAFDLPDFDIEDLENCLFAFCEDQESPFVIDLICRLLRGCYGRKDIESYNYEVYLKDIFKFRAATEEVKPNPFEISDFKSLDLRVKVEVLHRLCDYRLDAEDVMEQLKGLDGDNMRVAPLGSDDVGATYWYFYGNRLYKEDPEPVVKEEKSNKKKKKEEEKKETKSKNRKGKNQKRTQQQTHRSRRGRILSKKRNFESSESETEEEDEESNDENSTSAKGRQSRSIRKSSHTNEESEETRKEQQGTRRSSRRSQVTPVVEKKTRGRTRKSSVNGNLSDDDSDEEWNTPLSKTASKNKQVTPGRGRQSARKSRQNSVESSDNETAEKEQKRKRGRPRQAVKITPDSSVNGNAEDQNMDDFIDSKSGSRVSSRQSSRSNSIGPTEELKDETLEDLNVEEADKMDNNEPTEDSEVKESGNEVKEDEIGEVKVSENVTELMDAAESCTEARDGVTDEQTDGITNVNNNHDLNSDKSNVKEETANEGTISESVKEENSESTEIELDIIGTSDIKIEVKTENKPPRKPLYMNPRWHLVASTMEEWQTLAESLKESTTKPAKDLYKCIVNDFLPEMPAIMEARERDKRKRQAEMAPRRVSARITMKMKEFQEQERILEEARMLEEQSRKEEEDEKERMRELERQEEERKMREERQKAREERQKRLELREQRAQLIAEGKELPPELIYTGNTMNSKYREDDDRCELDKETLEDMEKLLEEVKSHKDSWPFLDPVDEEIAPGYHDIIKKPMDLSMIEQKLNSQSYRTTKRFIMDLNLMINNCFQFSGADSELGRMATRLRRFITKCIKIYLDKNDGDDDDEDFHHGNVPTQTERKWRPRRAATSRALDTLRGAFDDEQFEELTSTPGHEYATNPRKKRLIPELSGESQPNKSSVINGDRGSKTDTVASQMWTESPDSSSKETKILTVNGKTFVYKFNNSPSAKKKVVGKPTYGISTSPDKQSTSGGTSTPPRVDPTPSRPPIIGANSVIRPGGAILPVSPSVASTGPKIIRIMSPLNQGSQPQTGTPSKAIRISDGMLLLDGKPTGIHISGKTKIIYRGAASTGSGSTVGQNTIVNANSSSEQNITTVSSGLVTSTGSPGQNVIRLVQGGANPVVLGGATPTVQSITPQNVITIAQTQPQLNMSQSAIMVTNSQVTTSRSQPLSTLSGQPLIINKTGSVVIGGPSTVTGSTAVTMSPSTAIKTIQPSNKASDSVGTISSVCEGAVRTKEQTLSSVIPTSLCQTFTLQSPLATNQNSSFPPYVSSRSSPSQPDSSNKTILVRNLPTLSPQTGTGPNISLMTVDVTKTSPQSRSLLQRSTDSLMGPPLAVPPKRKLSCSPENNSTLPPKLHCIASPGLTDVYKDCDKTTENRTSPPKLTFMGATLSQNNGGVSCDKAEFYRDSADIKHSSDLCPTNKIPHSVNSPDKGNLFEILKTNLSSGSTSQKNKLLTDSNESVLSKGLMDKVSTFAASLQSRTLSGRLSIPSHLLQKSPTKDEPAVESTEEITVALGNSAENMETS